MAKLKDIIDIINTGIEAELADKRFAGSVFHAIATQSDDSNATTSPYIIDSFGEATNVLYDDNKPVVLYHKYNGSNTYRSESISQFGDDNEKVSTAYNITLIVFGSRNLTQLQPDDLETLIVSGMPTALTNAQLNTLNLLGCNIIVSGSDHNSINIFKREFTGQQKKFDPRIYMFALNYTIECSYDKGCINTLCC